MISEAWSPRAPGLRGHRDQEGDARDPLREHTAWCPRCIRGSLTQQMDEAPSWGHEGSGNDHSCPPSQETSVRESRDSPCCWSPGEGMSRREGGSEYPPANQCGWTYTPHPIQKLTQKRPQT